MREGIGPDGGSRDQDVLGQVRLHGKGVRDEVEKRLFAQVITSRRRDENRIPNVPQLGRPLLVHVFDAQETTEFDRIEYVPGLCL